jgi:DNA-binding protein HU-beta
MNKKELVAAVAEQSDITHASAERVLDAFTEAVSEALSKGEDVSVVGFGSFTVKERAARAGRNPRTGESIAIPAGRAPAFRPGKGLRDAVSGGA